MSEKIKIATLEILAGPPATWDWYKLDRALSARGLGGQMNPARIADSLTSEGLVKTVAGRSPAMPTYSITEKGRRWLKEHSGDKARG